MNKGELRSHIKDVMNRTDLTDALTDTFIEQTLSRIQRLLRIPSMERTATQTAAGYDGFVVPNNSLEIISIRSQGNQACTRMEYSDFVALSNVEGTPTKFSRELTNRFYYIQFHLQNSLRTKYMQFTALTTDTSTNEISNIVKTSLMVLSYAPIILLMNVSNFLKVHFKTT